MFLHTISLSSEKRSDIEEIIQKYFPNNLPNFLRGKFLPEGRIRNIQIDDSDGDIFRMHFSFFSCLDQKDCVEKTFVKEGNGLFMELETEIKGENGLLYFYWENGILQKEERHEANWDTDWPSMICS